MTTAWPLTVPAAALLSLLNPATVGFGAAWLALVVDRRWGEPPWRWHPVVWMGAYLGWLGPRLWPLRPLAARLLGMLGWCAGAIAVWWLAETLQDGIWTGMVRLTSTVAQLSVAQWLGVLLLGLLLKPLLAWRMLRDEVLAVEQALADSLPSGRAQLARLVSRDVTALDTAAVREAAIETLAENLNDSVLAPLLAWAMTGLAGAALYRFANTADAMWGYRDHRRWGGAWAARADDVLSWVPARLTAAALWLTGRTLSPPADWSMLRREAARTPSPNGGWPMAAMALGLGLRLGKPGVYLLNAPGRVPAAGDVAAAVAWAERVVRGVQRALGWGFIVSLLGPVAWQLSRGN